MATTKKKKPRTKKAAASEPAAAKEPKAKSEAKPKSEAEPKAESEAKPKSEAEPKAESEAEPKEVPTKRAPARKTRIFHIYLVVGASYSSKGFSFVAGRPLITTDEKIHDRFKDSGRFRIDVREGGAK